MKIKPSQRFEVEKYPFSINLKPEVLYNSQSYLSNYQYDNLFRFSLIEGADYLVYIYFCLYDNQAQNARFSGVGGFEGAEVNIENVSLLLSSLSDWGKANGITAFTIKMAPEFYLKDIIGFKDIGSLELLYSEYNQHIEISSEPYISLLKRNERKRLRKCQRAGYQFKKLTVESLQQAYEVVKTNRELKGYPVTVTYDQLLLMFQNFPDQYLLFGVFDEARLIAVAVSIRVSENVLYNFYHGDDFEYRRDSPVVMVINGVYEYCQENNIQYLDLGISSVQGVLNEGLYQFKENCGAQVSPKEILIMKV